MNIYLVQHGKAVSKEEDPKKPLSDKGVEDIRKTAAFLKKTGVIRLESIFHSGKTRARQTAEILGSILLPGRTAQEQTGLSPLDDVSIIAEEIKKLPNDAMFVGHLPHLGRLTSHLTTGSISSSFVGFQQGGVVCLKHDHVEEGWMIAWMLVPEIIF